MGDADDDLVRLERDALARERALDVHRSFLVQAPAGSGKTGLLIQRFLALLAHVDRPERVVAMTFTRKAATEMHERVLAALRAAHDGAAIPAGEPHAEATRRLALAALAQDARHQWQLLLQPSRLRMMTIDALAAALSRQAPVATGLGAMPAFVDDASPMYVQAVREALAAAEPDDARWRLFLARLDNDADHAVALLASLLARRDQWLRLPWHTASSDLRPALEHALRQESEAALARVRGMFPSGFAARIVRCAAFAADQLRSVNDADDRANALTMLAAQGGIPSADAEARTEWLVLADFLLVKDKAAFRQRAAAPEGFPPAGKDAGAPQRTAAKRAMMELLADARERPGLAAALAEVRTLPPLVYGDDAWAFVEATLALLPRIAGHLLTVFAAEGAADFSEATLRALTALGAADDPGQLLLAVDLQLAHVLVDEFQDTSWTQRELIVRLTAGWEEGDGRTLFAVGDPMQSIYRFREAEVGIFLEAQSAARIAGIAVECLDLVRNFRSRKPIVDWVNTVFSRVLPPASDPARGEVAYKRVLATRRGAGDPPTLDVVGNRQDEALAVVRRIRAAQVSGSRSIAILVRERRHLDVILPMLRHAGVDYAAIELETLAQRLATRDLVSLTRTLTQPADRVASLALLRAPWCGLTLDDLLAVARGAATHTILESVADPETIVQLSQDGQRRSARLCAGLRAALAARGRTSLVRRVRAAWLALGGPACGEGAIDAAGAERFFALLGQHERAGDVPEWDAFVAATERLFAEPPAQAATSVQIMTLHRAKGLEFDTVVIPGLARVPGRGDEPALRWQERDHGSQRALLLAPLRAREGAQSAPDPVYQYLKSLDAAQTQAEGGRLLYVGCTRARERLHLIASLAVKPGDDGTQWQPPAKTSALAQLWPALQHQVVAPPAASVIVVAAPGDDGIGEEGDVAAPRAQPLRRLAPDWSLPTPPVSVRSAEVEAVSSPSRPTFDWARATAAAIGTVAHRLLAHMAQEGLAAWEDRDRVGEGARITSELAQEGVPPGERAEATQRIASLIQRATQDARARWLFDPAHTDLRSEWALAGLDGGVLRHVTLDHTFVTNGVRWIVDFKTGRHEGGDVRAFLDREYERYSGQLEGYARIVRGLDPRPIRLGLYFPLVDGGWREWAFGDPSPGDPDGGDRLEN